MLCFSFVGPQVNKKQCQHDGKHYHQGEIWNIPMKKDIVGDNNCAECTCHVRIVCHFMTMYDCLTFPTSVDDPVILSNTFRKLKLEVSIHEKLCQLDGKK